MSCAKISIDKEKECGASLLEYSILIALIAVVSIAALQAFGTNVSDKFTGLAFKVENAGAEISGGDDNF